MEQDPGYKPEIEYYATATGEQKSAIDTFIGTAAGMPIDMVLSAMSHARYPYSKAAKESGDGVIKRISEAWDEVIRTGALREVTQFDEATEAEIDEELARDPIVKKLDETFRGLIN